MALYLQRIQDIEKTYGIKVTILKYTHRGKTISSNVTNGIVGGNYATIREWFAGDVRRKIPSEHNSKGTFNLTLQCLRLMMICHIMLITAYIPPSLNTSQWGIGEL